MSNPADCNGLQATGTPSTGHDSGPFTELPISQFNCIMPDCIWERQIREIGWPSFPTPCGLASKSNDQRGFTRC